MKELHCGKFFVLNIEIIIKSIHAIKSDKIIHKLHYAHTQE